MKAFVTGGTGFIGSEVVRLLVARGYEVICLARSEESARRAINAGAKAVRGDILDPASLPSQMSGCDIVFHIAGFYRLGATDLSQFEETNVNGTRHVLETALKLRIKRIVYISSIAIFGDTHMKRADETYAMPVGQPFVSAYDRSKWLAIQKVVEPLKKRGAPIITVIPSAVYGPGDTSLVGQLLMYFMKGWLVLFPGPETYLSLTYVDDAAEGIVLAGEAGQPGDQYILAGETVTLAQACKLWVRLTGWPAPLAYVPARLIHRLEELARVLQRLIPGWPEILSPGAIRVLGVSYAGTGDKARQELGWDSRPLAEGMQETLAWVRARHAVPASPVTVRRRQVTGLLSLAGLAALLTLPFWIFRHRGNGQEGVGE